MGNLFFRLCLGFGIGKHESDICILFPCPDNSTVDESWRFFYYNSFTFNLILIFNPQAFTVILSGVYFSISGIYTPGYRTISQLHFSMPNFFASQFANDIHKKYCADRSILSIKILCRSILDIFICLFLLLSTMEKIGPDPKMALPWML